MIIINVIAAVALVAIIFIGIRNNRVFKFRSKIIDMVFEGPNWEEKRKVLHNGPSYNEMLLSFRLLELESFYTPEQVRILNK